MGLGPTPAQLAAANLVEVDTYQQIELAAANGYPPRTYDPVAKKFPPIVKAYVSKNYQNPPTPVPTPLKVGIGTQSSLLRWPWNPNNASALQLAQQMGAKYFRADVGWNWSNGSWTSLYLASSSTLIGTYSGAGQAQAITDNETYLGLSNREIQLQFLDSTHSWASGMANSWYIEQCAGAGKAIMSIPMLIGPVVGTPGASGTGQTTSPSGPTQGLNPATPTPTLMTLADVGNGVWDSLFTEVFTAIASVRPDCILRIGWELYGSGWYPWSGPALAAQHKAAFIDLVKCARAVSSEFQFDWNGGVSCNGYDPITQGAWPGAEYVDYVSADVYENQGGQPGAAGWTVIAESLAPGLAFAQSQGKPFSIPEFGLWPTTNYGSGDDPAWIEAAASWVKANESSLGYVLYFNNPGSTTELQNCPQSAAAFTATFGALAASQSFDPQAAVKINALKAECAQYGLELILVVSGAWAPTYSPGLSGNVPNSGYNTNYPCTPQQFADAMSWLVARCPGLHWEIGNELDRYQYGSGIALLMNPALYMEILSLCYPAMKAADPSCVVHLGPVANINQGGSGWNWLAGLYKNSVTPHSLKDIISIHLYPGPTNCPYLDGNLWGPDLNIQYLEYQAFLESVGETAATWITEIGWPSVTTNSSDVFPEMTPQLQAQYTTDFLNAFNELGPEVIILFSLGDAPSAGLFYGQVSGAGPYTPKPVFAAIQALTK